MRPKSSQAPKGSVILVIVICTLCAGVGYLMAFATQPYLCQRLEKKNNDVVRTSVDSNVRTDVEAPKKPLAKSFEPVYVEDRPVHHAPKIPVEPSFCEKPAMWGTPHHGGWMICEDSKYLSAPGSECIIYSYGLGADWSFDNAAEARGCEVHGFDPSGLNWRQGMHGADYSGIDYAKQYPSTKKIFHNWGLGASSQAYYPKESVPQDWPGLGDPQLSKSNSELWLLRNFQQTFFELKHVNAIFNDYHATKLSNDIDVLVGAVPETSVFEHGVVKYVDTYFAKKLVINKKIDILKVDVEGAEWDALAAMVYNDVMFDILKKGFIKQLLLEWHWDPDSTAKNSRHDKILERIVSLGFVPWHIERHEGSDCCLDMSYVWTGAN